MSENYPVIGITTYRQPADWRDWVVFADVVPATYAKSLEAAGAVVVLLPPAVNTDKLAAAVQRIDGLVLAGGSDINPARYGEAPEEQVTVWMDDRDASELAYLAAADQRSLPVLGVCRGMQLLAVSRGGRLHQHLPKILDSELHSGGYRAYSDVTVDIHAGYRISEMLPERVNVRCYHHQGVAEHPGFVATATSADGSLHAIEEPGERFVLGVQWHPEEGIDPGLFRGFIDAVKQDMAKK